MNKSRKVLIIKTGFSEFLDRGISTTVSLGDVLICTSILHLYKKDQVTWLTSWTAQHLLKDNPYIKELLIFGSPALKQLAQTEFDVLINLEKDIGICTFLSQIKAKKRYGFYFSEKIHDIATHKRSTQYLLSGQENHKDVHKTTIEILYEAVGKKWKKEGFILHRKKRRKEKYDIGFNYSVGTKWPTKAWPMEHWQKLELLLKDDCKISWQQGHRNIFNYIDWIDQCRLIVTSDSLGQALAQALGKQVITFYGPTNHKRMEGVPNITVVEAPLKCPHMPCFLPMCVNDKFCMEYIEPQKIAQMCRRILSKD